MKIYPSLLNFVRTIKESIHRKTKVLREIQRQIRELVISLFEIITKQNKNLWRKMDRHYQRLTVSFFWDMLS